jgi:hypothetical protein
VIKIDVEGAELDVLRGATETLRKMRPKVLVEVHGWGDPTSEKVKELLANADYTISLVGRRGREAFCLALPNGKS